MEENEHGEGLPGVSSSPRLCCPLSMEGVIVGGEDPKRGAGGVSFMWKGH